MPQTHLSKSRTAQKKGLSKNTFVASQERRRDAKSERKNSLYNSSQKKQLGSNIDSDARNTNIQEGHEASVDASDQISMFSEEGLFLDDNALLDTTQDLPIRKPQSAYVIFGKMKRDQIMRQNPGIKVTEVVKQIAKLWQGLQKDEKQRYKEAAKQDKERYTKELKELTRSNKVLNKPKKPLTPYMLFVRETRPKVVRDNPDIASLDIMKEVGRIWQSITKDELEYFKEKSRVDMDRYKKEHEHFINEINELRQKTIPDQSEIKLGKEIENQIERVPDNKKRQIFNQDFSFSHQKSALKEPPLLHKRSRPVENDTSLHSTIAGTPLKTGKPTSPYSQQELTPSQNIEEPVSPYMKAKRDVARPKKPLSAYIYFSQEYREKLKEEHPEWSSHEIMKHVSGKWAHMDKYEKQPYNDMAADDKARYDKQLVDFAHSHEGQQEQQAANIFDLRKIRKISDSSDADMQHHQTESTESHTLPEQSKDISNNNSQTNQDKFETPSSDNNLLNQHTDDTNYRRYQSTPSRNGQYSIFNTNNLSPFTIKPFNNEFEIGSGQRKLFADEPVDYGNDRPYRFDTPISNKFKLFDENNCLQHQDTFGQGNTPSCSFKQNLFGDDEMYEHFVQMRGHQPYSFQFQQQQ